MPVLTPWCSILIVVKKIIIDISHNRKKRNILATTSTISHTEHSTLSQMTSFFWFICSLYSSSWDPHRLPTLLCSPQAELSCTGCAEIDAMMDDRKVTIGKASKGKMWNQVIIPLIRLCLLNSHGKSTSWASTTLLKVTFVTSHSDDHLLNDLDATGAMLRAVHASVHLILTELLRGIAVIIPFLQLRTLRFREVE